MPEPTDAEITAMLAGPGPTPAPSPTPAPQPTPATPPITIGGRMADMVDSVNSGIGLAVHETAMAASSLGAAALRPGEWAANTLLGTDYHIGDEANTAVHEWDAGQRQIDGSAYQPKTVIGGVTQGITQFLTGFGEVSMTLRAQKAIQGLGSLQKAVVVGAGADAIAFDPHQARLSNLVQDLEEGHPYLKDPITSFLASNPDDSDAVGRLKNAMEGMAAGVVIDKAVKALSAIKRYASDYKSKGAAKAEEALQKAHEEAQSADSSPQSSKGTQGNPESPIVDSSPSGTKAEVPPVDAPAGLDAKGSPGDTPVGFLPDDHVNFKKENEKAPNAPLLDDAAKAAVLKNIKDNPDWLSQGFVNTERSGFNYRRMDGPDGAKLAMEELAPLLPQKHLTLREIEGHASDMGMDAGFAERIINSGNVKAKDAAAMVVAGKRIFQSLARDTSDLARRIGTFPQRAEGEVVDAATAALEKASHDEFAKMLQRTADFQVSLKNLQGDSARAVTAGRIRTADSFSADELKAIAASNGDLAALLPIIKEKPLWVRLMNAHHQLWINSLLSGPRTHIRNIVSNSLNTLALPTERVMGGLITGNGAMMKEGANLALGVAQAFKDSIRMAVKVSGMPQILRGEKDAWKNTGRSLLDEGNSKLASHGPAISTENFKSFEDTATGTLINGFGHMANIPSRLLTTADEFFKQINYRAHVTSAAMTAGQRKGLKGKDLSNYIADRLHGSMDENGAARTNYGDGIYKVKDDEYAQALDYARRSTFTSKAEAGSFLKWLETGTNNHPYLKLILPFVRTPVNIMKAAAIRTPVLNLASKKYREALSGRLGERARADAHGQMAIGVSLYAASVTLAMEGLVTGKGPSDPKEMATLQQSGWQPYSFKVGGSFISFQGMDPLGMFFGIAGDFADGSAHMSEADRHNVVGAMAISIAQNITSKTYLQGLTQVMDALSSPDKKMESFLRSRLGSYVPSALNQTAGLVPGGADPYTREARTYLDTVLARLPGFSQMLPPKRNVFGEAITARQGLGPDSISPFFTSTLSTDPAKLELARLSHAISPPSQSIGKLDLTQFKNLKGQDFYDRWQEQLTSMKLGRYTLKERLDNLVTSEHYAKIRANESDALSVNEDPRTLQEVRAIVVEYRDHAKQKTLKEYPEVAQALRAQKQAGTRADAGAAIPDQLKQLLNFNK